MYNEAQGSLEVRSFAILGLLGSNQFMLYPKQLCHSFLKKFIYLFILALVGLRHCKGFALVAVRGELAALD